METGLIEICPICIENPAECYTECGHCYCIGCLIRIKKCALCRKLLLRTQLCIEIKSNTRNRTTDVIDNTEIHVDHLYLSAAERRRLTEQPHLYTMNINVLRIMTGMSGLAYST